MDTEYKVETYWYCKDHTSVCVRCTEARRAADIQQLTASAVPSILYSVYKINSSGARTGWRPPEDRAVPGEGGGPGGDRGRTAKERT
jgi:hypothetical protein